MNLSEFELSDIDFNNIGAWPLVGKIILIAIVGVAIIGAGIWFDTKEQLVVLEAKEAEEQDLRKTFKAKQQKANAFPQLKKQLRNIEITFGGLLRLLPNKTQVPEVVVEISQRGTASGIELIRFEPQKERVGEGGIFMEFPIELYLLGNYHALGEFVSDIAGMRRIVTQHNVKIFITKHATKSLDGKLGMNVLVKTYYYKEDKAEDKKDDKKDDKKAKSKK
jgi:type IV pilus assembly protein PilO